MEGDRLPLPPSSTCRTTRLAAEGDEHEEHEQEVRDPLRTPVGVDPVLVSPLQAVVDYVRSYGVKDAEITRLGVDRVSWRGAQFRAVLVPRIPVDAMSTARPVSCMTREQRDLLRKQIDARMRERLSAAEQSRRGELAWRRCHARLTKAK